MSTINKTILIGRLGNDPELFTTKTGQCVTTVSLATNETWKDEKGEKKERTDWHSVIFWGESAKTIDKYCKKGDLLYVEGPKRNRTYGENNDKVICEVHAKTFQFLTPKGVGASAPPPPQSENESAANAGVTQNTNHSEGSSGTPKVGAPGYDENLDDLPF